MDPITLAAIGMGAAAAGQLAGRGIGWLAGGGRAARKAEKKESADAQKEYRKGQLHGWGLSGSEKRAQRASAQGAIDQAMTPEVEQQRRQEAAQGFGRTGLGSMQRAAMARDRANAYASASGSIEANDKALAVQKRQLSLGRMAAARGAATARAQNAANAGQSIGGGAVEAGATLGVAAYGAQQANTLANVEAATGAQPTRQQRATWRTKSQAASDYDNNMHGGY